jgi:hypothetical protein
MPQKKDKQTFEPGISRDDLADFLSKNTEVAPIDFPKFAQHMAEIIMAAKSKPTHPRPRRLALCGANTRSESPWLRPLAHGPAGPAGPGRGRGGERQSPRLVR